MFDRVILVEDTLAREFIEKVIENNVNGASNLLYTIIPVGGWEKVFEIYQLNKYDNFLGKKVLAVLDGDVEMMKKYKEGDYKGINHGFLPIKNIEDYITEISVKDENFKETVKTKYLKSKNFDDLAFQLNLEYYFDFRNKFKDYVHPKSNKDVLTQNFEKFIEKLETYKNKVDELIESRLMGDKKTIYKKLKLEIIKNSTLTNDNNGLDTFFIEEIIKDLNKKSDTNMKQFIGRINAFFNKG